MTKELLSLVLVALLVQTTGFVVPVYASTRAEKEARQVEKVKAAVARLGTSADAWVKVTLRDRTKLQGYISGAGEDSFVITDAETGTATTVPYPQVKQVKTSRFSTGEKIAIGAIITATAVGIAVILSQKGTGTILKPLPPR